MTPDERVSLEVCSLEDVGRNCIDPRLDTHIIVNRITEHIAAIE